MCIKNHFFAFNAKYLFFKDLTFWAISWYIFRSYRQSLHWINYFFLLKFFLMWSYFPFTIFWFISRCYRQFYFLLWYKTTHWNFPAFYDTFTAVTANVTFYSGTRHRTKIFLISKTNFQLLPPMPLKIFAFYDTFFHVTTNFVLCSTNNKTEFFQVIKGKL